MEARSHTSNPLVSNRVNEKSDLQNLNHRFSAYIQTIRAAQEHENQQRTLYESNLLEKKSDNLQNHYEQRIAELQAKLEDLLREKQELDLSRVRYETSLSDYENRIVSLNETLFEKQNELQRLHGALAAKDVELQEARADAAQPRMALDGARMEADDFRKRLEESERRLQLETQSKMEIQQQLSMAERSLQQEILIYQQELSELRGKLEKSHQLILQLEDKARKAGQNDASVGEMMKKVREASELELRRFMEETEAKYNLNIQEVKMRMNADVQNLSALAEENGRLRAELDGKAADVRTLEAKLSLMESQKLSVTGDLENERASYQSNIRSLEQKLKETQDLLLVKIQELGAAQEANIPLRAEINALKALIEEEEKRLNLSIWSSGSPFSDMNRSTQQLTTSAPFAETLGKDVNEGVGSPATPGIANHQLFGTSDSFKKETNASTYFPMPEGKLSRRRPASVPISTRGFRRSGSTPSRQSSIPLATPIYTPNGTAKRDQDKNEHRMRSSSSESSGSQIFDLRDDQEVKKGSLKFGIADLPPRPENPTPTKLPMRPASAKNARFIPATAGEGRDYFEAMFNDLRKDSLYTKVTETDAGVSKARVTSVDQDKTNSTSRPHDEASSPRKWFSGTSSSATGNLNLLQVSDDGSHVRVSNISASQDELVGGFMLQQNVGGHPVAVFRFPPRARIPAASSATVWSAKAINGVHDPPSHYIWSQLDKWGTGPECTTVLCRPNGQAVAWITSAPLTRHQYRPIQGFKYEPDVKGQTEETQQLMEEMRVKNQQLEQEQSEEEANQEDGWRPEQIRKPASYTVKPTLYGDTPYSPKPNPVIKRPLSSPSALHLKTAVTAGGLPSRTGSAPLQLHHKPPTTQYQDYVQRLSTTDRDIIDLTTQKSARSRYGFDFMTHRPTVTNYDGTVR